VVSQVTDALVDAIRQGAPDLGDWVVRHSLSAAETDPQTSRLVVALVAVAPHLVNRPLLPGPEGWVRRRSRFGCRR